MKKEWLKPELMNLGAKCTNEVDTKDFPHYFACTGCGKHYLIPGGTCKRCGGSIACNPTFCPEGGPEGGIVTLPDFSDQIGSSDLVS